MNFPNIYKVNLLNNHIKSHSLADHEHTVVVNLNIFGDMIFYESGAESMRFSISVTLI